LGDVTRTLTHDVLPRGDSAEQRRQSVRVIDLERPVIAIAIG
jgi:hypothetical protein